MAETMGRDGVGEVGQVAHREILALAHTTCPSPERLRDTLSFARDD